MPPPPPPYHAVAIARHEMRHIAILNELQNIKLNGRPREDRSECEANVFLERCEGAQSEKAESRVRSYLKNASHDVSLAYRMRRSRLGATIAQT